MGKNKIRVQKEEITLAKRRKIWNLRLRGYTQYKIADEVGIDQSEISRQLKKMREEYRKQNEKSVQEHIDDQVSRLEYIVEEAFNAWNSDKKTGLYESKQRDKDYLQVILKAMEDIRKIYGVHDVKETHPQINENDRRDPITRLLAIFERASETRDIPASRSGGDKVS